MHISELGVLKTLLLTKKQRFDVIVALKSGTCRRCHGSLSGSPVNRLGFGYHCGCAETKRRGSSGTRNDKKE